MYLFLLQGGGEPSRCEMVPPCGSNHVMAQTQQEPSGVTQLPFQMCGSTLVNSPAHLPRRFGFSLLGAFKDTLQQRTKRISTSCPPTHISAGFQQV